MRRIALVAGAGGSFGGVMAQALAAQGWDVRRYARGTDMAAAARGAALIVNGLNPPGYHNWNRLIPEITSAVLAAGRASGATILVPGNVYPYGVQRGPWGPDTRKSRTAAKAASEPRWRRATARPLWRAGHGQSCCGAEIS